MWEREREGKRERKRERDGGEYAGHKGVLDLLELESQAFVSHMWVTGSELWPSDRAISAFNSRGTFPAPYYIFFKTVINIYCLAIF